MTKYLCNVLKCVYEDTFAKTGSISSEFDSEKSASIHFDKSFGAILAFLVNRCWKMLSCMCISIDYGCAT